MVPLFECVPNISEGVRKDIINLISIELRTVKNLNLLNVDSNASANRTVFTFIGPYNAIVEAADRLARLSTRHVDMRTQNGEHPRIGSIDVFPIIPLDTNDIDLAIQLGEEIAQMMVSKYQIPIYFYQKSALTNAYRSLETIRKGEYESLSEKWNQKTWLPNLMPEKYNPKTGATVLGVRDFLIAYNINIKSPDVKLAKRIAKQIRSSGDLSRPHRLPSLKAFGWWIEDFQCCQISTNLVNYNETNMHHVFEKVQELASAAHVELNGSELIGLVPKNALIQSGIYYSDQDGELSELEYIEIAVQNLGLNSVKPFGINDHIIEYCLSNN